MSEVLTAAAEAPQTDALAETTELPKPVEAKLPEAEPKPEVKKNPDQQRSDAVKNAIDKALKPEEAKPAKADAKPEAEIKPEPVAKDRAADGKFAAPVAAEPKPEPKPTAFRDAPPRFDDAAKSEWEAVPEGTRGAIHRTVRELEQGITKHREAAEAFEPIRKYADMAKQSGTDLATALQRFTGMEQELRRNPIAGLQAVVANLGIKNPQTGMPVTLRDIAAHVLGQKPDQVASQHEASNQQLRQQVAQLQQQISGVTQHVQSQQQEARVASVACGCLCFCRRQIPKPDWRSYRRSTCALGSDPSPAQTDQSGRAKIRERGTKWQSRSGNPQTQSQRGHQQGDEPDRPLTKGIPLWRSLQTVSIAKSSRLRLLSVRRPSRTWFLTATPSTTC